MHEVECLRHILGHAARVLRGDHLLCARLRQADRDAAAGSVEELTRIVDRIRRRWPTTEIVLRGDSGFCRDDIMDWCEQRPRVHYVLGLAKNARLKRALGSTMHRAMLQHQESGRTVRLFDDVDYRTRKSWSRSRRVIGKAEHSGKGANPRFVVSANRPLHDKVIAVMERA